MSINLTGWLSIAVICLLGAMSPGPSLAVIARHALQQGRQAGLVAALSHGLAVTLYAVLAVSGLVLVISRFPVMFSMLQYAGALFLCYLGALSLLAAVRPSEGSEKDTTAPLSRAARDGFGVAFLNPKLALFFLALFSQFLSTDTSSVDKLILVATMGTIDAAWYCLIALVLTHPGQVAFFQRLRRAIDGVFGCLLIGLGVSVLYQAPNL
ncbi:MAG: LysE family translocator [Pseudomonadota bacterium]